MPKQVIETVIDMAGSENPPTIQFSLEGEGTIAERLYASVEMYVSRDDGVGNRRYPIVQVHVGDSDVATFSAGDSVALRGLLNKLLNHAIAEHNLD